MQGCKCAGHGSLKQSDVPPIPGTLPEPSPAPSQAEANTIDTGVMPIDPHILNIICSEISSLQFEMAKDLDVCQDLCQFPASSSEIWISEWGGVQNEACVVRHKLNLYIGSPVTVAYGVLDNVSELSQSLSCLSWRQMEMVHQAQRILRVCNRKKARNYDILVDFQTGGNFPVLVRYIYKLVTKCDGAQKWASVFYIPTLVALFNLLLWSDRMLLGSMHLVQDHGK